MTAVNLRTSPRHYVPRDTKFTGRTGKVDRRQGATRRLVISSLQDRWASRDQETAMHVHRALAGLGLGFSIAAAALAQPQQPTGQPERPPQPLGQAQQPAPDRQQQAQPPRPRPMTSQEAIASAMSAAPPAVAAHATVAMPEPGGAMRTLREGTNGFTCMPDNPATPATDPMCLDRNAMQWRQALQESTAPPDAVGIIFVLIGDANPSNTDPHASTPAGGAEWIVTGPHIMIVGPALGMMEDYPRGAAPDTSTPYVMWSGTPYEHLRVPIR